MSIWFPRVSGAKAPHSQTMWNHACLYDGQGRGSPMVPRAGNNCLRFRLPQRAHSPPRIPAPSCGRKARVAVVIAGLSRSPVVPETFMGLAECFISPFGAETSVFMNIDTSTDDSLSPAPPKETRTKEVCRPCDRSEPPGFEAKRNPGLLRMQETRSYHSFHFFTGN